MCAVFAVIVSYCEELILFLYISVKAFQNLARFRCKSDGSAGTRTVLIFLVM